MKYDVVALGELLIDFTETGLSPQGNRLLEVNPGGAPCNVLAMLAGLGRSTCFIGKVGQDMFGDLLRECHANGIGVSAYFSGGLDHVQSLLHRDWLVENEDGQVIYGDRSKNFFRNMCMNSGYKDYLLSMVKEFIDFLEGAPMSGTLTSISRSVESHLVCLAAEKSRVNHGAVVEMRGSRAVL